MRPANGGGEPDHERADWIAGIRIGRQQLLGAKGSPSDQVHDHADPENHTDHEKAHESRRPHQHRADSPRHPGKLEPRLEPGEGPPHLGVGGEPLSRAVEGLTHRRSPPRRPRGTPGLRWCGGPGPPRAGTAPPERHRERSRQQCLLGHTPPHQRADDGPGQTAEHTGDQDDPVDPGGLAGRLEAERQQEGDEADCEPQHDHRGGGQAEQQALVSSAASTNRVGGGGGGQGIRVASIAATAWPIAAKMTAAGGPMSRSARTPARPPRSPPPPSTPATSGRWPRPGCVGQRRAAARGRSSRSSTSCRAPGPRTLLERRTAWSGGWP